MVRAQGNANEFGCHRGDRNPIGVWERGGGDRLTGVVADKGKCHKLLFYLYLTPTVADPIRQLPHCKHD